ncbi:MAG TPA: hypothetical protein VMT19_07695 [Thermoanaerobaculaceae bacterium]|nr:hypothetical protein [Thermoanaerobaculaceae bacterium]
MASHGSDVQSARGAPGRATDPGAGSPVEPAPAANERAPRRALWLAAVVVLLPLLTVGFLADDFIGLVDLGARGWPMLLDELHPRDFEFFRPLGFLFFRTELSVFGARAWLFHASHLALFVVAAAMAGRVAARLAGPRAAGWVAALALLYPGRMEAAAWVAAMFDLLALLLTSAALLLATAPGWDRGARRPLALAGLCFVAPLAKESAFAIPIAIAAWEALGVLSPAPPARRLARCGGAFGGAALAFGCRLLTLGGVGGYAGTTLAAPTALAGRLAQGAVRAVFAPVNPTYGTASDIVTALCAAAAAAAFLALLLPSSRDAVRPAMAGLALAVAGLLPALPYLDPSALAWSHSRFITIAGMGIAVAVGVAVASSPLRWRRALGGAAVAVWLLASVLNELPWLEAARCRDVMLDGIAGATRSPGQHSVWVAGHINETRGAQLLGGALAEAVALTLPGRAVRVDSEFLQAWQHRPVGPPSGASAGTVHVFRFDASPPRMVEVERRPPPVVPRSRP